MFDSRNNLSDSVELEVRGHFGDKVYETVIPRNVRVSEAPSFGKPVLLYDTVCRFAGLYTFGKRGSEKRTTGGSSINGS